MMQGSKKYVLKSKRGAGEVKDVISTILSLLFIFASIIFGFTAIFAICLLLTRDWVDALIIFTLLIIYKILPE